MLLLLRDVNIELKYGYTIKVHVSLEKAILYSALLPPTVWSCLELVQALDHIHCWGSMRHNYKITFFQYFVAPSNSAKYKYFRASMQMKRFSEKTVLDNPIVYIYY